MLDPFYFLSAKVIKNIKDKNTIKMANPSHRGLNTHHQLQSILSSSLRVIKTIVSNPAKPIPPLLLELELFDISFPPFNCCVERDRIQTCK